MTSELIQALVRHVLTALAAWLVTSGYLATDDAQTLIGAGLGLTTVGWSIYNKLSHQRTLHEAEQPAILAALAKTVVLIALCLPMFGLSSCAQYRQAAEAGANVALADVKAANDDAALAISIAPQAITLGAFARLPSDPRKCALATLAGVDLNGCTVTAAQISAIVSAELTQHFGAAR